MYKKSLRWYGSLFVAAFFVTALLLSVRTAQAQILVPDLPSLFFTGMDGYTSDGVEPNLIYLPAQPTFAVRYYHPANLPPAYVKVVVDSVDHVLSLIPEEGGDVYSFAAPTGTFAKGIHYYHFETSDGTYTDRLPWNGELQFEVKNTPVILIPGILGSEQKNGEWVIDPILHTYDNLIATFEANGYTDGVDFFTFPYEWRQSNVDTAIELEDKINFVKRKCGCTKVDLVAHSMGGLVARQYIESDDYQHDVDQLIFLGTPHLGAPGAYLTWEAGETGRRFSDRILNFLLSREAHKAGFQSLFDYVRHEPITSLQELLPVYDYLKDKNTNNYRQYPNNYPQNIFLEDLNTNVDKLNNSEVSVTNVVGDLGGSSTINTIRVVDSQYLPLWQNGFPDGYDNTTHDLGLEVGHGDGTVSLYSSSFIKNNVVTLNSEHGALVTDSEAIVVNKFTGSNKPNIVNNWFFPDFKIIIFKILSPADIVVIAPDGKRVGKDFISNQEVNDIDGAFYSGFETDNEFVTIPNPIDGVYTVEAQGTGNGGEYTIAGGFISNTSSSDVNLAGTIAPGQINVAKFRIDEASSSSLVVAPTDITPPVITILSPTNSDYSRPFDLPINVSVTDTESGVASQIIYFDDTLVHSGDQLDLFLQHLGAHSVFASSTDNAGNSSTSSVSFRIVASTTSTIADVESAFIRGWISDKRFKQDIIDDLKKIVRWESRINWLEEKLPGKRRIVRKIEKLEKIIDRQLAKDILKDLKIHLKKGINQQAYDILVEDVNWLINN